MKQLQTTIPTTVTTNAIEAVQAIDTLNHLTSLELSEVQQEYYNRLLQLLNRYNLEGTSVHNGLAGDLFNAIITYLYKASRNDWERLTACTLTDSEMPIYTKVGAGRIGSISYDKKTTYTDKNITAYITSIPLGYELNDLISHIVYNTYVMRTDDFLYSVINCGLLTSKASSYAIKHAKTYNIPVVNDTIHIQTFSHSAKKSREWHKELSNYSTLKELFD